MVPLSSRGEHDGARSASFAQQGYRQGTCGKVEEGWFAGKNRIIKAWPMGREEANVIQQNVVGWEVTE